LTFAQAQSKIATEMSDAWSVAKSLLFLGFGIDDKSMKKHASGKTTISRLFYVLLVLTDLDALGFFLSYSTYWSFAGLGHEVVKAILIFFPVAYAGVLMMNVAGIDQDASDARPGNAAIAMMSRPASPMELVHFVPILRGKFYLQPPSRDDIEAIFRINTLSSFSLGVAQFAGMMFYLFVGEGNPAAPTPSSRLTPTIIVNIVSLAFNWSVTILYFCTSIPDKMKDSIGAQALDEQLDKVIHNDQEALFVAVREVSAIVGNHKAQMCGGESDLEDDESMRTCRMERDKVRSFRKQIGFEMAMLEDVLIDLKGLPVDDLEVMRSRVFKKYAAIFQAL